MQRFKGAQMHHTTLNMLKTRQKSMHIPYEIIAEKAGLGIATVKRFFSGANSSISTVEKIAAVLMCDIYISTKESGESLLESQIEQKALYIVNRVMKTSALELQKPDNKTYQRMLQKAKESIRKMPKSQIWS
jgi:transcriptional regulator with XRE-family HTH domain